LQTNIPDHQTATSSPDQVNQPMSQEKCDANSRNQSTETLTEMLNVRCEKTAFKMAVLKYFDAGHAHGQSFRIDPLGYCIGYLSHLTAPYSKKLTYHDVFYVIGG
jgi:hypothetical protein